MKNTYQLKGWSAMGRLAEVRAVGVIQPHGGFAKLSVYRKIDAVYQGTLVFCRRFLPPHGDRTVDQMVQAARSGKQNVVEGSDTSGTSRESEIRLTDIARASLAELKEDYLDYLKAHGETDWPAADERKVAMRNYCREHNEWADYQRLFATRPAAVLCNLQLVLISQARRMLEGLLKSQEETFCREGGFRERMRAARESRRADGWENALWSWLASAPNCAQLQARESAVMGALRRMADNLRRRNGW